MNLDGKSAIKMALKWLENFPEYEEPEGRVLEAFRFHDGVWEITFSFSAPWDEPDATIAGLWRVLPARRAYKVVILDDATQSVIEMRDREPPANQLTAP
jgi:uncharacterized protein with von Willebrand factor type A (vWA) domain